ncbi:uncharacterized protein LOC128332022 isoform X4 [Hemicordylus capensis]|uniref:uncharacterized protein LOC128332022 isoform X4 n=1 Tax=Hemicordylus capensis TaxID=884348 RepID=UPI0023048D84|nr:uncharacterized protein LOC128332022 isoform X4 [Hemicordylus capensis]
MPGGNDELDDEVAVTWGQPSDMPFALFSRLPMLSQMYNMRGDEKKNKKRVQCNNRKQTRTGKTPNITADILHECVLEWENESQPEIYAARSSVDCVGARQHAEEKTFHFP